VLDSQLRRLSSIDPLGIRTSVVYDSVGQVAASVNPLGQRTSFSLSEGAASATTVNAAGAITTSIYDLNNRLRRFYRSAGETDNRCLWIRNVALGTILPSGAQVHNRLFRKGSSPRQLMPRGSELPMPTTLQQIAHRTANPNGAGIDVRL
jgi:YD repeat-containing protein